MDAHRVTMRGPAAEIRWAYYTAAGLGPWTLEVSPTGGTVSAPVLSQDAGRLTQTGLTFVVPRPNGVPWRWPIRSLTVTDTTITAQVGPMEA